MVKHPERQKCIRDLNSAAKQCGVQGVTDESGRPKVLDLLQKIRQSAGPEAAKTSAESTWTKYEATFSQTAASQDEQETQPANSFRLRGKSFLFTYNWDFLNRALPDGTPSPANTDELWQMWLGWTQRSEQELKVVTPWRNGL